MTFADYVRMSRRWWWLVLAGTLIVAGAAYALTSRMTPIYRAQATILVNQAQSPGAQSYQDILGSQQLTKTYAEVATSSVQLSRALELLNDPEVSLETLRDSVSASAVRETQLIRISAEHPDPERAAHMATAVAEVFPSFIEEAQLAGTQTGSSKPLNTVFVAESADIPESPVRPSTQVNTVVGALLGVMLMVAVVAIIEYRDDGIDSREAVRELDVPFLGGVPTAIRPRGADAVWVPSIIRDTDDPALVEAYRQVQANLSFALGASDAKVLLVTSSQAGEGKSTTAANLAEALAESSRRVLLVDCDLRKPDAQKYFSLPNTSGVTTAMVAEAPSIQSLVKQVTDSFFVLTAGPVPPNPAEMLASRKMAALVQSLSKPFDVVVIDSPPILGLADASILASLADGVVLVARRKKTRRGELRDAIALVRNSRKPLIGLVLNGEKRRRQSPYYRYGYGYGYRATTQRTGWTRFLAPWRLRPARRGNPEASRG